MGSKNDTALGQNCNIKVKKQAKTNATFFCPCVLSLAEHMDLWITGMLESVMNLTKSLKNLKKSHEN